MIRYFLCVAIGMVLTQGCATVDITQDEKHITKESLVRTGNPSSMEANSQG